MLLKYLGFSGSKKASSSKKHYPTVIEELCHQFSLEDLRKSTNNFDKKLVIGKGGFGTVYKGCLKHNGAIDYTIALKRLNRDCYDQDILLQLLMEIVLLCQLRHPNLVSLVGFCNHKKENIIVYEYMPNGTLHDHLNSMDMEPLSWKKRLKICIGAARGVHYLHTGAKRIIFHLDIKPGNILLDNNMVPKLSDFGLSFQGPLSTLKYQPPKHLAMRGTRGYLAPEFISGTDITEKTDVYSFGMVLVDVVRYKRRDDMWGFPIEEIIDPILKGKIAPECWEVFMDITKRCLKSEPDERPTIGEVEVLLEHALSLQEEADVRMTDGDYTLVSTTMIFEPLPSLFFDDEESHDGAI